MKNKNKQPVLRRPPDPTEGRPGKSSEEVSERRWWQRDWFFGLILAAVTMISYLPAWNGSPIWDDDHYLTPPQLRPLSGLARIWIQPTATLQYYPLTYSSFWIQHRLWGDAPLGYHLVNILLHIVGTLLLLRILRYLEIPGAPLAAAVFALHPLQVESVTWISELKNTLSGAFCLGSTLIYLHFDQKRRWTLYGIGLGLFVSALLAKTVVATLPAALLVIFWWKRGKLSWKQDVMPLIPFFVIGTGLGVLSAWMERNIVGASGAQFQFTFVERGIIAGRAIWFYLGKLVWPAELIFIYPRWQISQAIWWQYLFHGSWQLVRMQPFAMAQGLSIWRNALFNYRVATMVPIWRLSLPPMPRLETLIRRSPLLEKRLHLPIYPTTGILPRPMRDSLNFSRPGVPTMVTKGLAG